MPPAFARPTARQPTGTPRPHRPSQERREEEPDDEDERDDRTGVAAGLQQGADDEAPGGDQRGEPDAEYELRAGSVRIAKRFSGPSASRTTGVINVARVVVATCGTPRYSRYTPAAAPTGSSSDAGVNANPTITRTAAMPPTIPRTRPTSVTPSSTERTSERNASRALIVAYPARIPSPIQAVRFASAATRPVRRLAPSRESTPNS